MGSGNAIGLDSARSDPHNRPFARQMSKCNNADQKLTCCAAIIATWTTNLAIVRHWLCFYHKDITRSDHEEMPA
jgi:hypothetical protein